MKALVITFAAAALMAVSTFAMAADGPGAKAAKANVNKAEHPSPWCSFLLSFFQAPLTL